MNKNLFLTSAIAMGFIAPAMADPERLSTFPNASNNEFMQENKIYTDAATSTNMAGVYEGEVDAVAQYTDNLYTLVAGQYLPANSETPITCDQNGYFCPGDSNGVYYQNYNQGLTQCPTGYGNTANGASANTDCYRTCTNADVAHSSGTVNGGYYYGDNNQCSPTACVNGWHVKAGLNLVDTIGDTFGVGTGKINHSSQFSEDSANGIYYGQSFYGISNNDTDKWAVYYGDRGMVTGQARCSTTPGAFDFNWDTEQLNAITTFSSLTDETGQTGAQYCYCNVTGYKPNGGTLQSVSSAWVFGTADDDGAYDCARACASHCAYGLRDTNSRTLAFRGALLGSVAPTLASCEANVITINWGDTDLADVTANEAGTATYGSDIRTPVKAQTKPGKTFTGWRFVAPQQASVEPQGD